MSEFEHNNRLRVLMVSSAWPSINQPGLVPFLVQQVHSLRKNGIDVDLFAFSGNQNPVRYAINWLYLHVKCMSSHYDLIHAQFGQSGLIVLPTRTPLVVTFHGSDLQGWIGNGGSYSLAGKIMQKASNLVAKYAYEVIVVSKHLAEYLSTDLTYTVIPCGVDLDLFYPISREIARRKLNLPEDKCLFLFAGNPRNPIKRFSLAKQAYELIQDGINSQLIVATDIPHNVMPFYLNACDVLIVTSKHEGSPTIIKEALACNLPVVSTDVGDVREIIGHLGGCEVCSNDDPQTIAAALRRAALNSSTFEGRSAVEGLDLGIISERIIKVYRRVLQSNGRRVN